MLGISTRWMAHVFVTLSVLAHVAACYGRAEKHREFFNLFITDRHRQFRTLPADQQVDIYIEAMRIHPPDLAFAHDIAETTGGAAVPVIIARLRAERDEAVQCHLLFILEEMAAPYGVTFDSKTVALATEVVGRMKHKYTRQRGRKSLAAIRGSVADPTTERPATSVLPPTPLSH